MEQTESLIVEQLKKGNERAYKFLYEQHYQILCHVAAQYVKDDFLAETIVGDLLYIRNHSLFILKHYRDEEFFH
jgi:RNA polymerase sigma-70 factor (ECF subfamily)